MSWREHFTHDRYGSNAEIAIGKEQQRRHLGLLYQRTVETWMLVNDSHYGKSCVVKNIRPDFYVPIRSSEPSKEYPLVGLRYLFIFLDGEEAHSGQQADRDFDADQFIRDQGSISLRYPYKGTLSQGKTLEIVDEIEQTIREAMKQ